MKPKLSDLWRLDGTVERGVYLFWGALLFAFKFNLDRLIGAIWFDESWSIFKWATFRFYLWQSPANQVEGRYYLVLLAASLPFLWTGVALTLRRLRSLGWQPWWMLLFFVPVLKLFFFALLCLLPSRKEAQQPPVITERRVGRFEAMVPSGKLGSATVAALVSAGLGLVIGWFGTSVLGNYGWTLFVGLPFVMGFLAVMIHGFRQPRGIGSCILTAILAVALAGVGFLFMAMEGAICLIMAAPLAFALGIFGGIVGYLVQKSFWRPQVSPRLLLLVVLFSPLTMGLEKSVPPPLPVLEVKSSVTINAPPETVWRNVVSFSQLPPPREMIFKLGIAYPIRAEITGHGAGAIRRCVFSTGPFVEPIEVWDEPRLLKFSVTQNPEPMQEWTPYRHIHPAHLDDYLQSCGGQFRLVPLHNNRTLLEGTTWYYHHMWPATYWQLWSDQIIHNIHLRVLNHIKTLSEQE
jgi:uncharacterized membrane protein YhaH (DUF805 family)